MNIFHSFYFNLLFFTSLSLSLVLSIDPCSQALLSLKHEIIDEFNTLNDWIIPSTTDNSTIYACSWSGVKCNTNLSSIVALDLSVKKLAGILSGTQFLLLTQLVHLNISYNSFSGNLPAHIFNLTKLESLDISRNNFSNQFPDGVFGLRNLLVLDAFSNSFSGSLPLQVTQLENLQVLNLAGSYFSGSIPSQYGNFKALHFLHLAGNFLTGDLPPQLGNLKTITHMEIGYNSYQGSIPKEFGNMTELQYLDVAGANLSGSIPKELQNLTKLQSLFLFRNQLTGLIPLELSKIVSMTDLDLSDNRISGPIPESFADLKNLRLLSLMSNELNGTVPKAIAELPLLDTLFIWDNFFSGQLPQNLGKNTKLRWVDVSSNNFIGGIPPDICSGGELFKLIMFSNSFIGTLPQSLSNCSSLDRLRLEDNLFSGDIPLNFNQLLDITYVDLSRNNLTGGIPTDITKALKLQYFNISYNEGLGSVIPEQTWSLPFLQNFSASGCGISGNLPLFNSCKSISVIELSSNNLSGVLPESLSSCQALERIDLADNRLNGQIPEKLATLPVLSVLDLSHNSFTGSLPANFATSSSLVLLNVSFNDISGSIPSEEIFRMMGSSAYVGNPKLCGPPLKRCTASMAILGVKGTKKPTLVLLLVALTVMFIVALILGMFYLRKRRKNKWKMVSFVGLPRFTSNDFLRSFSSIESTGAIGQPVSAPICKAVLPTGITVSVKKLELEAKQTSAAREFITIVGNTRHKNLIRLLGVCYNNDIAYLLYDYKPNGNLCDKVRMRMDGTTKYKIMIGIAKGLCFLHHDCYPAMPHGDLNSSNVMFDENMEPQLAEFGFKYMLKLSKGSTRETGEIFNGIEEELSADIYNYGEIIMEILTNGRLVNAGGVVHNIRSDVLLRDIYSENEVVGGTESWKQQIKLAVEVALLCTRTNPSDRPTMKDALKLLSG